MQHSKDKSAMIIAEEEIQWANAVLFDDRIVQWASNNPNHEYIKYFPPHFRSDNILIDKLSTINALNLRQFKNLEILDIGTGTGHFPVLVNRLGHHCEGTDIPEMIPVLEPIHTRYNLNVSPLIVEKQKEIKLDKTYDIITSLRITFDGDDVYNPWLTSDWNYFKDNILNFVNPGGTLFLKTNIKFFTGAAHTEAENAFGTPLPGWNSLTFKITKS